MSRRKVVYIALTLHIPKWMNRGQATREVRTLINEQRGYMSHGPDFEEVTVKASHVKAISLNQRPAARTAIKESSTNGD